jgi:uncharacterized protein with FMN-binding domain
MHTQSKQSSKKPSRIYRKLFLSAFVASSFLAYAIHKPLADPNNQLGQAPLGTATQVTQTVPGTTSQASVDPSQAATSTSGGSPTDPPTQQAATSTATTAPTASTSSQGQYKNGTYTGSLVNVFVGDVQVQVSIQNGKIANVQFLTYPSDRRTSVQINQFAMPYLEQEAIQTQSANVNIITGATLTSEGFIQSLQSALSQAQG